MNKKNNRLLLILAITGVFIAVLIYLFHSETGQFEVLLNGQPVSEPLIFIGAVPAIFVVLVGTAVLMFMTFMGVGLMLFVGAMFFLFFGIFLLLPFSWPVLLFVFLIIIVLTFDNNGKEL